MKGETEAGRELARKAEVESCHATGPEGCLKGLDLSLPFSLHTYKHTEQAMQQGKIELQVQIKRRSSNCLRM